MNTAAEGREHADTPVTKFVAAALDDDVFVAGYPLCGGALIFEIAQQILRGVLIEAVVFDQFRERRGARHREQLPSHPADRLSKLRWTPRRIPMPERHF